MTTPLQPLLRLTLGRPARALWRGLVDALVPNACGACGETTGGDAGVVCGDCRRSAEALLDVPYCGRCGRTLAPSALHEDGCARCRAEAFWNVRGVARVGLYAGALPRLIVDLKLRGQTRNAGYLAELLARAIRRRPWGDAIDVLVPVPSHWLRRWQRSTEHTLLLAEAAGRRLGVSVLRAVTRVRAAASQTSFASKERRLENVRGCFGPPRPLWRLKRTPAEPPLLAGKTVCIVDNVMYSGATVHEVSKVVRRLGARTIYAAVVSRPPSPGDPPIQAPPPDP